MTRSEGLQIKDVARASGLHETTIRDLDRRGVISSTRDSRGWRVFHPDVVPFLKRIYRKELPEPTVFQDHDNVPSRSEGDYLDYKEIDVARSAVTSGAGVE
jgi:hypothetical protein